MPFKLENEFCRLEVIPEAAEITYFFDKTNNVEIMYQGDEGWSGRNPSLFPIIGSTYSKYYEIHGKQYTMKNHGLARYATFKGEQLEDKLIFTFCSDEETLKQYPFDFVFEITYSLEGKTLHIDYTIKNTSKEDMPYSFGLHPAFRVPQYKNEKFEDYSIDFEFNEEATQLVFDPSFNENIKEKKVQLNSWKLSREDINHYATLVYKDYKSSYVTLSHQGEPRLRVHFAGFPYLALWTHPTPSNFICIEPWYGHSDFEKETPDFYHREGTMILKPGEETQFSYQIELF